MVLLVALVIFAFLAWATWAVAVACYAATVGDPADLTADPSYPTVSGWAVAAVTATSFVPFPLGYVAAVVAWGVAVYRGLSLSGGRAALLLAYLAGWSVVTRLVVLGVLSVV